MRTRTYLPGPIFLFFAAALFLAAALLATLSAGAARPAKDEAPIVIRITQTGCQFVETEGKDHRFRPESAADCRAINAETAARRLGSAKTLRLRPGKYIFRLTNKNVPYPLGFYLRGAGTLGRFRLPGVSGGGLDPGATQDYEIELLAGEYLYSCPLNPTPNYKLIVGG
ncbi:MAG: hypothetical protein O2807_06950 [bacterium]|nr:hypothetical protein [bacterium]